MADTSKDAKIRLVADDQTGPGLSSAEKKVKTFSQQIGQQFNQGLTSLIAGGVIVATLDRALETVADSIRSGKSAMEIGIAIGEGIANGIRSIPIVGPVGEMLAPVFDDLFFGGAMQSEKDNEAARKQGEIHARNMRRYRAGLDRIDSDQLTEHDRRRQMLDAFGGSINDIMAYDTEAGNNLRRRAHDAIDARMARDRQKALEAYTGRVNRTLEDAEDAAAVAAAKTPEERAAAELRRRERSIERERLDAIGSIPENAGANVAAELTRRINESAELQRRAAADALRVQQESMDVESVGYAGARAGRFLRAGLTAGQAAKEQQRDQEMRRQTDAAVKSERHLQTLEDTLTGGGAAQLIVIKPL